jgi:hypothetical protein
MVDVIDQFLLHILGAILFHCLVNSILKLLPRSNGVDRAMSAFQVYAFVLVEGIGIPVAVDITGAFRVAAEEVASGSNHSRVCRLRLSVMKEERMFVEIVEKMGRNKHT